MVNVTYDAGGDMIATAPDGTVAVYNPGDIAWITAATALVMIMTPGVGFFYSGLLRRKNALSMLHLSFAGFAVVSVQWIFWGYSLAFSSTASTFIGNLDNFGFMGVLELPSIGSPKIPALCYAVYQMMFATITPVLAIGGFAERGRLLPAMVFMFVWATLVYDPVACWTWNSNGWGFIWGTLDFAGGGPVHMTSGTGALAISVWLGKRRGYGTEKLAYKPHNVSHIVLGTVLLWFGWFGFNGGSALAANLRALMACMVTNTAAAVGGLTWMTLDWIRDGKWSAVGFCSGAISGLVGITPASGYVAVPASIAIGFLTAIACNYATLLKHVIHVDDAIDIFASHGVGGFVGALLTGIFADSRVASFDGFSEIPGGWINHHYIQLAKQLANGVAIISYSFAMTLLIVVVMDYIPGMSLRVSDEAEILGVDIDQMGELAYDYVTLARDLENPEEVDRVHNGLGSEDTDSSMQEKPTATKAEPKAVEESV